MVELAPLDYLEPSHLFTIMVHHGIILYIGRIILELRYILMLIFSLLNTTI